MDHLLKNFGVGVDLESNQRFVGLSLIKDNKFLTKIFTPKELEYCFSKDDPSSHLCVRFAAKEAAIKAVSSLDLPKPTYVEVEIINDKNGAPFLTIKSKHVAATKVSLSHSSDYSIAFVLVSQKNED